MHLQFQKNSIFSHGSHGSQIVRTPLELPKTHLSQEKQNGLFLRLKNCD